MKVYSSNLLYKSNIRNYVLYIIFLLAAMILFTQKVSAVPQEKRLAGLDRYQTAAAIARDGWKQSDYAVLAYGENFPDALAAAPLAKKYNAPILLTDSGSLSDVTRQVFQELGVRNVFIVGGTGVVSLNVENQIKNMNINTIRLAGLDRYDTAVQIAKEIGGSTKLVVTTGEDYPDALSVASIAARDGMPIILVPETGDVPDTVRQYANSGSFTKTYIIGGIYNNVYRYFTNPESITGNNKYDRNIAVLDAFKGEYEYSTVYMATGNGFADALAGSAHAAVNSSPIILVGNRMDKHVFDYLKSMNSNFLALTVLGGDGVVPENMVQKYLASSYVADEVPAMSESELKAVQKAMKYMTGGEYTIEEQIGIKTYTDEVSGITAVFADSLNDAEKASFIKKLKPQLAGCDFVYELNGEAYLFIPNIYIKSGRDYRLYDCFKIAKDGTRTKIKNPNTLTWDFGEPRWDKDLGIVWADSYRINHRYDSSNNIWVELNQYVMLGTEEQRFNKSLSQMANLPGYGMGYGDKTQNPLGLDPDEVQKYLAAGDDTGFKTFKVARDANGKPAFIINIGPMNGFHVLEQDMQDTIEYMNNIDPKLIRMLADQYGICCLTNDIGGMKTFENNPGFEGTFWPYEFGSVVFLNDADIGKKFENSIKQLPGYPYNCRLKSFVMAGILMESRALYTMKRMGDDWGKALDKLSDNTGLDKALWARQKADEYYAKKKISELEYSMVVGSTSIVYDFYNK